MKAEQLILIGRESPHNDMVLYVVVACMLILCASKYLFAKNVNTLMNKSEYLSFTDDNTTLFSFIINVMMVALASLMLVSYFNVTFFDFQLTYLAKVGVTFGLISGVMLFKLMIEMAYYKAFYNAGSMSYFMKSSSYVNARNILILLLSVLFFYYTDLKEEYIMIFWFILLVINRIWEIVFRYTMQNVNNKSIWYYNILYLCTLEILPILVLAKLLMIW